MRVTSTKAAAAAAALLALPGASAQLNKFAQQCGKTYFGTGTDNGELSDAAYVKITGNKDNFGQMTPGNGQKWDATEPSRGHFSFTNGDVVVDFAEKNNQIVRCHTLLYRSQLPSWVSAGSWTKEQMTSVIQTHISNVVGHYKGQCYTWDVVNEAIDDDGNYRDTIFHQVLGTDYIPIAFQAAADADPNAKLFYNDYNIEATNAKQQKTLELVKLVQNAGVRIDGVGLQGHFIVGSMPAQSDLESVMNEFVALNVDVAYTEMDVKFLNMPYTQAGLEQQAQDYAIPIKACLNVERCVGWTIWDWTDKYSWVSGTFPGQGGACLYDESMQPKPAYSAVSAVLAACATAAPSSTSTRAASSTSSTPTSSAVATPTTTPATQTPSTTPDSTSSTAKTPVIVTPSTSTFAAPVTPIANATTPLTTPTTFSVVTSAILTPVNGTGVIVPTGTTSVPVSLPLTSTAKATTTRRPCSRRRRAASA